MAASGALLLLLLPASTAEPLTLRQALERSIQANLELRQDRLVLQRAELGIDAARGDFDPSLWSSLDRSVEGGSDDDDRSGTTTFSAGLSQPLGSGGSTSVAWYGTHDRGSEPDSQSHDNQLYLGLTQPLLDGAGRFAARYDLRAAVRSRDYQTLVYRAAVEELVVDTAAAYWSLVAARETLLIARRSLAFAQRQLTETEERRDEGFAALGDVLQVERAVYTARQAEVVAQTDMDNAEVELLRLLGHDLNRRPPLDLVDRPHDPDGPPDMQLSVEIALEYNASWLAHDILVQGAAEALRLARNGTLPSLDLSSSVGLSSSGDEARDTRAQVFSGHQPAWSVGLSLSMPIPGRAEDQAMDQAWLGTLEARLARESAEQSLIQAVEQAVREVRRDTERVALARRTVEIAQAALDADRDLVEEGRGSTRELVRSLETLDEAEVSALQAEIELQLSLLELMRVEGLILTKLALER